MNRNFIFIFIVFLIFLFLVKRVEASNTVTFYSTSSDGNINAVESTYWPAWAAGSGYDYDGRTFDTVGQIGSAGGKAGPFFIVDRLFFFFDTSSIPDGATIHSANISLYGQNDNSDTDFSITVQNGQPGYPRDPLQAGDYNKNYYSGNGGSIHTSIFINTGYNNITLNPTGRSWINKAGTTKLAIRSSKDISGSSPGYGSESVSVKLNESGSGYQPMLTLNWTYIDLTPPTYSNNRTTFTSAAMPIAFRLLIDDETMLQESGQYEFAIDNCTGSFVKDDLVNFTSTSQTLSVTKTVNSTVGCTIRWYFNFSDHIGNWNDTLVSTPFSFVTTKDPPTFSNNATNSTIRGTPARFTISVTDNVGLDPTAGYIFSTNNSGTWVNSSFNAFTGSGTTLTAWDVTTLNSTAGAVVQWRFFANDTYNNWNVSGTYSLTTEPDRIPPTYSNNQTSSTSAALPIEFSLTIDDETILQSSGQYEFAIDNCTGSFVKDDLVNFTSTSQTLSVTKTVNSTIGCTIRWYFNFSDDSGNWNDTLVSTPFSFVTTKDPPTFSNNATDSTDAGTQANFTISVTDNFGLDPTAGYIFSTNNSGTWVNSSYNAFTGSGTTLTAWDVTTLNSTERAVVQWRFFANDTYNNWNVSGTYSLTTIGPPQYFDNSVNSTLAGTPVEFRLRWTDNVGLSGYIFSFWNGSDLYRTPASVFDVVWEWEEGGPASNTIDNDLSTSWIGISPVGEELWVTYDLGVQIDITNFRIYSPDPSSEYYAPCNVTEIYISNDPNDWGTSLGTCSLYGPSGFSWRECDETDFTSKAGRYIKILFYATTSPTFQCTGELVTEFYEFDVYTSGLVNDTWVQFPTGGTEDWSNVTKTVNSTIGSTIRWKVYANGTSNRWNASEAYNLPLYELTGHNQGSNATAIKSGDPLLLYTNWTSRALNLSHAILSTNETGQWQNYTDGTYGSPLTLSGNESWSNFTWQNNSIKTTKVVGWKIYVNNSFNNWNVTEQAFTIDTNIIITMESTRMTQGMKIFSRPGSIIKINGTAFYSADNSLYINSVINFTYDPRSLESNTTDSSGIYQFSFSIPYEGVYTLTASTTDSNNNTGQNTTTLRIATRPINVRFRMSYRIGSSKASDIYRIGTSGLVSDTINNLNLMNIQYSNNLTYGYICTYDQAEYSDGLSLSLIHSGNKPDLSFVNFSTTSASANYILELKQKIENNDLLLTYTKGTCQSIHDKMYLVERYEIPSRPFSSFSYPMPAGVPVLIRFKDDRIQINGSDRFSAGDHKVCAEKSGISSGNKPIVDVGIRSVGTC